MNGKNKQLGSSQFPAHCFIPRSLQVSDTLHFFESTACEPEIIREASKARLIFLTFLV